MVRAPAHTVGVVLLCFILLAMPWSAVVQSEELESEPVRDLTAVGSTQTLLVSSAGGVASNLAVEVPYGEALTGLSLKLEPAILSRSEGISWTTEQHFNHSDAIPDKVDYNNTGLGLVGIDMNWDLDHSGSVPPGWTRSTSTYSLVNTQNCGTNGSGGASLSTRGSSTWWNSPVVDLSGLSNGQVSYWVRQGYSGCGEEPDSNENFYAQYKTSSGSFATIRTFSGSTNGYGATGNSYTTSLPSAAFHSNFQMRFYQNSGSGTCCDYWYFDDVSVTRPGGEGNWTSPSFGWSSNASYSSLKGPHGIISFDAEIPSGAVFEWELIDATTGNVMPGYVNRTDLIADLGAIDWQRFPDLRVKLHLVAGSGGALPALHGIHINGRMVDSFHDDPGDRGWTHSYTYWDDGAVAGTGNFTGPVIELQRPLARLNTAMSIGGAGQLQVSLDGAEWVALAHNGVTSVDATHTVQFRIVGSGSWSITEFRVDLDTGGMALDPMIDVGRDGVEEWSLSDPAIGPWGWQDRLSTGALSHDMSWFSNSSKAVSILLPAEGVNAFSAGLTSLQGVAQNVSWTIDVGSVQVAEGDLGAIETSSSISLNTTQLESLSENLSIAQNPSWSTRGIEFYLVTLNLRCESGDLRLEGLRIPYDSEINLMFSPIDDLVQAINDEIPEAVVASGNHHVSIPLVLSAPGAVKATITNVQSSAGTKTDAMVIRNVSQTVVASEPWIEVVASHLSENGVPDKVQLDLVGGISKTRIEWPIDGSSPTESGDIGLIEWHPDHPFEVDVNGSRVHSLMRFRIEPIWDDEDWLEVRCRLVLSNGVRSVPAVVTYGAGQAMGLENDVRIDSWQVFNDAGGLIPVEQSQIRAGHNISIEVQVGFDSLPLTHLPRSGIVNVSLLQNGEVVASTTELSSGVATFTQLVPLGVMDLTYRVEIEHLFGGEDVTTIMQNRTFVSDSLAPYMVGSNIRHHDHLESSSNQVLQFEIHDQPSLPNELTLMLWRSWLDDWDFDGWPNAEEYTPFELNSPADMDGTRGNYTYFLDDTSGGEEGIVAGYIVGTDPAGNPLVGGGGSEPDEHLFMYQLKSDGSPSISTGVGFQGGHVPWLHPGNSYVVEIPLEEPNGMSDIDRVVVELASNAQHDTLPIIWRAENRQCTSFSEFIVIESCYVSTPEEALTPYTEYITLEVEFTPQWRMPDEGTLRREPSVEIVDRAGQSAFSLFPSMRWRWSTDLMVDSESVSLSVQSGENTVEGAWATPGAPMVLTGQVVFAESGQIPHEGYMVKIALDGSVQLVSFNEGSFYAELNAPIGTGNHPLTWSLDLLPIQARDVTSPSEAMMWIVVDGVGPVVTGVVAPRLEELPVQSLDELTFDIRIKELEEIDPDSLELNWRLVKGSEADGEIVLSGVDALSLPEGILSSQQIRAMAVVGILAEVDEDVFLESTSLHIWVTGRDIAGNPVFSSSTLNSETAPFATWSIERYRPIWEVSSDDIDLPLGGLEVNQVHSIPITLRNEGMAGGTGEVWITGHDLVGDSYDLFKQDIYVASGESELLTIEWQPKSIGLQWLEIYVDGELLVSSAEVDVRPMQESGSWLGIEGVDDSVMIIFTILLLALVGIVFLFLKDHLRSQEDDWGDDYWEDEDAHEYEEEQQYDPALLQQPVPVQSGGLAAQPQHTDPYATVAPVVPQQQAQPQAVAAPATPAAHPTGLTPAQAVHQPGVGPGWMQDEHGRWWKQNAEGYWYRLGEDGGWYPPEQNQYGWS